MPAFAGDSRRWRWSREIPAFAGMGGGFFVIFFVSSPTPAFCFLPRSRFLFPSLLPLSVFFPAPAFCFLSCFRFLFSSLLLLSAPSPASAFPPLLPLPPPFPFPRKRESPVNWGGAGNARTAPLILCRRVFAVRQRDQPCRIFWRFGRIAAATPTAN